MFLLFFAGITECIYISSVLVSMTIASKLFLKETITFLKVVAMVISIIGVFMLVHPREIFTRKSGDLDKIHTGEEFSETLFGNQSVDNDNNLHTISSVNSSLFEPILLHYNSTNDTIANEQGQGIDKCISEYIIYFLMVITGASSAMVAVIVRRPLCNVPLSTQLVYNYIYMVYTQCKFVIFHHVDV